MLAGRALVVVHLCQVQVQVQLLCVHESAAAAGPGLDVVQDVAFLHGKHPTQQHVLLNVTGTTLFLLQVVVHVHIWLEECVLLAWPVAAAAATIDVHGKVSIDLRLAA
jgi:hypothetical protein